MLDFTTATDNQLLQLRKALIHYLGEVTVDVPVNRSCIVDMDRAIENELMERDLL